MSHALLQRILNTFINIITENTKTAKKVYYKCMLPFDGVRVSCCAIYKNTYDRFFTSNLVKGNIFQENPEIR